MSMTPEPGDLIHALKAQRDPFLCGEGEDWDDIFHRDETPFSRPFYQAQAADAARRPQRKERAMRCAHGHCRTSLADETAVFCPHLLPFCEHCTWEEACDRCNEEAVSA